MLRNNLALLILIAALALVSACQHKSVATPDLSGVALDNDDEKGTPQINPNAPSIGIGPENESTTTHQGELSERSLVGALVLGPGLYNVAGQVASLALIKKLEPAPRIITGHGLGAWVASLYAFGQTPQLIEWKLFKFFSDAKELAPFSAQWREELASNMLGDLGDVDLSEAKMILLLPVYDKEAGQVVYLKRGNLRKLLLANVTTVDDAKNRYSTPIEWGYFSRQQFKSAGADFVIGIDVLASDVRFERPNDFLMGVYGRLIGWRSQMDNQFDFLVMLPWSGAVDSTSRLSFKMLEARKEMQTKLMEIQEMTNSLRDKKFKKE